MAKFYELTAPKIHLNGWSKDVWRVRAADPNHGMYLHNNGKVVWGIIELRLQASHADFFSLDEAYFAIINYYTDHGQPAPVYCKDGVWYAYSGRSLPNGGQTAPVVVDSTIESEPMEF